MWLRISTQISIFVQTVNRWRELFKQTFQIFKTLLPIKVRGHKNKNYIFFGPSVAKIEFPKGITTFVGLAFTNLTSTTM